MSSAIEKNIQPRGKSLARRQRDDATTRRYFSLLTLAIGAASLAYIYLADGAMPVYFHATLRDARAFCVTSYTPHADLEKTSLDADRRFRVFTSGAIHDTRTGLEWHCGRAAMNWTNASNYAGQLQAAGGDWRLPTMDELRTLWQPDAAFPHIDPVFQVTHDAGKHVVWSSDLADSGRARCFSFDRGSETHTPKIYMRDVFTYAVRWRDPRRKF